MASKLLVNELQAATGSEITIAVGTSLTGGTNVFKITGGLAGQSLITDGAGNISFGAAIPSVTGQSGKFLTTDGTLTSWDTVDALPTQTGQAGEFLQTDGTTATWESVDALPTQTGQAGEYLQTDGTTATWEPVTGGAAYDTATTSTGYFDMPAGTTAQRPGTPAIGNMRWNTTDEALEHYSGATAGWVQWAGAAPTITGIVPTTSIAAGTSIIVSGINFQAGSLIKLIGNDGTIYNATSTTFVSATEISFLTPNLPVANEPYDVKLILPAGGTFIFPDALDAGGVPVWTTLAGSLGALHISATGNHYTLAATDPDSQTVTFSMDTANTAILTSAGLSLNATTGVISGDATDVSSSTTYAFDVIATDSTGINSTTRSFSITIADPAGNQEYVSSGNYTWTVPDSVVLVHIICVGAGGGAGCSNSGQGGGGGALVYRNDITVVPGQTAAIVVGAAGEVGPAESGSGTDGGNSTFTYDSGAGPVTSTGGGGGGGTHSDGGPGGSPGQKQGTHDGGGNGGTGGHDPANRGGPGGGGAGGYSGDGGTGANPTDAGTATGGNSGSGGGGGGGGKGGQTEMGGGGGGGVGIYGAGSSGGGGTGQGSNTTHGGGGSGGSGGVNGGSGENTGNAGSGGIGGAYGGGQGGTQSSGTLGTGGVGAVRIIWGPSRNFPSNAPLI